MEESRELGIVFDKYKVEFYNLIEAAYCALNNSGCLALSKNYQRRLYVTLKAKPQHAEGTSRMDLRQDIAVIWCRLVPNFYARSPSVSLKTYLIENTIWSLRDNSYNRIQFVSTIGQQNSVTPRGRASAPSYDLNTISYNHGVLTPYESYLFFLKFTQSLNILEISRVTQSDLKTTRRDLKKLLTKLKRRYENGSKESNGSCEAGPGYAARVCGA